VKATFEMLEGEPLEFHDRESLLCYLRSPLVAAGVEDFLARPAWTLDEIAHRSVDSTTARAIPTRSFGVSPLSCFRSWARAHLGRHWRDFVTAQHESAYQSAVDHAVLSLQSAFAVATQHRYALTYGRASKMLALTLKHVALLRDLTEAERRAFFGRVHVALDRYTLAPVAQLAPELGLPRVPSMGNVERRDGYIAIQQWIATVCAEAGVPPSTYEVATFNIPRGVWQQRPVRLLATPLPDGVRPLASRTAGKAAVPARTRRAEGPSARVAAGDPPLRAVPAKQRSVRAEQVPEHGPHTAPWATVTAHRHVEQAPVIEVFGQARAHYREASFEGRIEVVDASDLEAARTGIGERTVRALLTWYGWRPQRRYLAVKLTGPCAVHARFDGEVIAGLGDPPVT